jgi:hypothetical protein
MAQNQSGPSQRSKKITAFYRPEIELVARATGNGPEKEAIEWLRTRK